MSTASNHCGMPGILSSRFHRQIGVAFDPQFDLVVATRLVADADIDDNLFIAREFHDAERVEELDRLDAWSAGDRQDRCR